MAKDKKKHEVPKLDKEAIKKIATKARDMRKSKGYSYEAFALHAGINRNTYFKLEKSAETGENFTIATLLKVIRGLDLSLSEFFIDL
jgi:transcriptional regulator with XRE-family HTH domain